MKRGEFILLDEYFIRSMKKRLLLDCLMMLLMRMAVVTQVKD